jgi:hypothetical protein
MYKFKEIVQQDYFIVWLYMHPPAFLKMGALYCTVYG